MSNCKEFDVSVIPPPIIDVSLGVPGPVGPMGPTGPEGPVGPMGPTGDEGESAYEVAVENGFVGTEEEWLASLKGDTGQPGGSSSVFIYRADTSNTQQSDPGTGKMKWNAATQIESTSLYFDRLTYDGLDAQLLFTVSVRPSTIYIQDQDFAYNFQAWHPTDVITYPDWFEVVVELVETGGNPQMQNNKNVAALTISEGVVGPEGPVGPMGPPGADGADGAQGPPGVDGEDGLDGATGPAGPTGPQGNASTVPGPAGPAGANGAVGPSGSAGADGAQGPKGDPGPAGANGATGPAGANGATGPAGANGAVGATGPAGANGAVGATGPQGPQGNSGITSATLTGDVTGVLANGVVPTTLSSTGVTAGTYTSVNISVDEKGRILTASNGSGGGGVTTITATGDATGVSDPTGLLDLTLIERVAPTTQKYTAPTIQFNSKGLLINVEHSDFPYGGTEVRSTFAQLFYGEAIVKLNPSTPPSCTINGVSVSFVTQSSMPGYTGYGDAETMSNEINDANIPFVNAYPLFGNSIRLNHTDGRTITIVNVTPDLDGHPIAGPASCLGVPLVTYGELLPQGGTTGQVLTRTTTDSAWQTPSGGGGGGTTNLDDVMYYGSLFGV